MLPLSLLRTAQTHQLLVELKNGDTYNGYLLDEYKFKKSHMHFKRKDGDKFWRMPTVYIRGNTIKYLCIPDEIIDMVQEEETQVQKAPKSEPSGRGGRGGGRGRGRGQEAGRGRGEGRGRGGDRGRGGRGRGRG